MSMMIARMGLLLVLAAGCGSGGAGTQGVPPGGPCGHYVDGGSTISSVEVRQCAQNAALPQCAACIFAPNDLGTPGICVLPCRIGGSDCPSGQTCVSRGAGSANGCNAYPADGYCQ